MALYVDKKQRQLLLVSEVTKEFPFLMPLLESNENIGHEIVKKLPGDQQIFFQNTLPSVLKQAQAEWYAEKGCEDYGERSIPCSICNTPNQYIYYITNSISGISINVGSDCIKKFFDDITAKKGGKSGLIVEKEHARKIKRLNDFYQHFPGADKMLDSWVDELVKLPFMIPIAMEQELKDCKYKGKTLIKKFQDRSESDDLIVEEFSELIKLRQTRWEAALEFVEQQKSNPWAVRRKIYEWLERNNKKRVLDALSTDCVITLATFSEIWEPEFLKNLTPELNKHLAPHGFRITNTEFFSNYFSLAYNGNAKVTLSISTRNFLVMMGPALFRNQIDTDLHDKIILNATIRNENDIDYILYSIGKILNPFGLILAYYNPEMDELFVVDEAANQYKVDKLSVFIKHNMGLVLMNRKPSPERIVKEVKKAAGVWYPVYKMSDLLNSRYGGSKKWYPLKEHSSIQRLS